MTLIKTNIQEVTLEKSGLWWKLTEINNEVVKGFSLLIRIGDFERNIAEKIAIDFLKKHYPFSLEDFLTEKSGDRNLGGIEVYVHWSYSRLILITKKTT